MVCLIIVSAPGPGLVRYQVRPVSVQKKFVVGWWGGVVCLIIVSAPGPGLVRNQLSDTKLGQSVSKKSFWWGGGVGWSV